MDLADPILSLAVAADPLANERALWLSRLDSLDRSAVADVLAHAGAFVDLARVVGQLVAGTDDTETPCISAPQQRALAVGVASAAALLDDRLGALLLSAPRSA